MFKRKIKKLYFKYPYLKYLLIKCLFRIMANKVQYDGIKYPFTLEQTESYFIDLNKTIRDGVRSQIMHVIFTPKGTKIRDPQFGTDLIRYIFEPNDEQTWSKIKSEISSAVNTYVSNVSINDINVMKNENDNNDVFVRIDYSVKQGNKNIADTAIVKI